MALLFTIILPSTTFSQTKPHSSLTNETVNEILKKFSGPELDYFEEIAFGSEFGAAKKAQAYLKRWQKKTLQVVAKGQIKKEYLQTLKDVFNEVEKESDLVFKLSTDALIRADIEINFVKHDDFAKITGSSAFNNSFAFFDTASSADGSILHSSIFIPTDQKISSVHRERLIREEVTQSLGLFNDSMTYPKSIFYKKSYKQFFDVTYLEKNYKFTDLDLKMINLLYKCNLPVGTTRAEYIGRISIKSRF